MINALLLDSNELIALDLYLFVQILNGGFESIDDMVLVTDGLLLFLHLLLQGLHLGVLLRKLYLQLPVLYLQLRHFLGLLLALLGQLLQQTLVFGNCRDFLVHFLLEFVDRRFQVLYREVYLLAKVLSLRAWEVVGVVEYLRITVVLRKDWKHFQGGGCKFLWGCY
jgi:hypothetical protein